MPETLAYGTWPSLVSAAAAAAGSSRLEGARYAGGTVWWGRTLPDDGGRVGVFRRGADGEPESVLPAPFSARSAVHEYGGGSWTVAGDDLLVFVDKSDGRVWALRPGEKPRPLTVAEGDVRFGGLVWQEDLLIAVRERHGGGVPHRDLVSIDTESAAGVRELVDGSTFLAQPAVAPGGHHLAWVAWDHPSMPWDATELRVGRLAGGTVVEWTAVTDGTTSALQPAWASADDLVFADDPTGRWNLSRLHLSAELSARPIAPVDADTGGPLWVLGLRWYGIAADGRIIAVRTDGDDALVVIDGERATPVAFPASSRLQVEDVSGSRALISGATATTGSTLFELDLDTLEVTVVVATGGGIEAEWMPRGRAITVPGPHGPVHAVDFPPTNPDVSAPDGERAPYVVWVHGGPTAHVDTTPDAKTAYFTSRGIGVLDVNYGGSSGYGRQYRERLLGQWGLVDVDDVAAAAEGLVDEGLADPARLGIAGGSAGGWTVLAALVGTDVFAAGISRYGVGDARLLADDTHDFESRYLDSLIGALPAAAELYRERSPLSHPERFRVPVLLLQGSEDAVVPPSQAEAIRDALAARGIPHAYVLYEGEGHGFRRRETLIHSLESEVAFLGAVFGFEPDGIDPIELD